MSDAERIAELERQLAEKERQINVVFDKLSRQGEQTQAAYKKLGETDRQLTQANARYERAVWLAAFYFMLAEDETSIGEIMIEASDNIVVYRGSKEDAIKTLAEEIRSAVNIEPPPIVIAAVEAAIAGETSEAAPAAGGGAHP